MNFLDKKVEQILIRAAQNIVDEAKSNLENGALKKSIRMKPSKNSIKIIMEDYGVFQDRGVSGANHSDFKGKRKTINKSLDNFKFKSKAIGSKDGKVENNIDKWMYKKGIQPRDKKSGRFVSRKSTNYLIRRSIAQHGIKPSLFLTTPYKKYSQRIINEFNRLSRDINNNING